MRRCMLALIPALLVLAGCTSESNTPESGTDSSAESRPFTGPVTPGEGQLKLLAWPGYAEDGSFDPAVDWVTPFEEKSGCDVDIRLVASSDEARSLLESGAWDVASVSSDITQTLMAEGAIQPLTLSLIPNYAGVTPALKSPPWISRDARTFGVPHSRGVHVLLRGSEPTLVDSWATIVGGDAVRANRVGLYDAPISLADIAVHLMSEQPELGITNPYALDDVQFDAVVARAAEIAPDVALWWRTPTELIEAFESDRVDASVGWQVAGQVLRQGDAPVRESRPPEGAVGWSDSWVIARDAANVRCAYQWLDWILSPEVNAQAAEWSGAAPVSEEACALTTSPTHCEDYRSFDTAFWETVYYWDTPTRECRDGRTDVECVPYEEWGRAWTDLPR